MRIAIVTRAIGRNDGQGRVNLEVAAEALAQGHEVRLFCEQAEPAISQSATAARLAPSPALLPGRLARDQLFACRLWPALAAERARGGVVLANGFASWAACDVNAVHFVHRAWLASPHHPWRQAPGPRTLYPWLYSAANRSLERTAFRRAGRVVAVSDKVRRELVEAGVPDARITTILNGVDTKEFHPAAAGEAAAARAAFGLPPHGVLALFAGDLKTSRKNLDTVLAALCRSPDTHLAVAGRHEATPWPAMARALGVADRVHFLGFQRDMPRLMRAADLFVFPSRYEACSLVLLEALASGLPVVTATSTGGAEIVTPDVGIVLPDSEDAEAVAAAIDELAQDASRRAAMARAARGVAAAHDWPNMARHYLDLLAEAASLGREKRRFLFFEKKKQKTFAISFGRVGLSGGTDAAPNE